MSRSDEEYEADAKVLREAMEGWGTNDEAIVLLTVMRSNADRQQIAKFYKSSYGEDLMAELKDELGGDLKKVVLGMFRTPTDYDCHELNRAMKDAGTNEAVLIEIIGSRSTDELLAITPRYDELFGIQLEDHIVDECSGDLKRLLVSLLQCNRSSNDKILNQMKCESDLAELYDAGEGTWGTDESSFNKIFTNRSPDELRFINTKYSECTGKTLREVIDDEFGGDMKDLLKTVLHSILNPADYFTTRLRAAFAGLGTNDNDLIRVMVSRDEIDMQEIKEIYFERYEKTLYVDIEDECSGAYKQILLGIAASDIKSVEESPASIHYAPKFPDGSNIWTKADGDSFHTFSCPEMLPPTFEVNIKNNKCRVGYIVIGVSDKVFDEPESSGYLGGDKGEGNWGIASNGSLGDNGSWKTGKAYQTDDIVTLKGVDGEISYAINGEFDETTFKMNTAELYLSFTFHYNDDELEILDE
jgi:annexin A7/11